MHYYCSHIGLVKNKIQAQNNIWLSFSLCVVLISSAFIPYGQIKCIYQGATFSDHNFKMNPGPELC